MSDHAWPGAIVVVDLRRDRGDLLRVVLEPLAAVRVEAALPAADQPPPALLVVDPPADGLSSRQQAAVLRAAGAGPVLVLGGGRPAGEVPGLHRLAGALLPSRLRSAAAALLTRPVPAAAGIDALTACLGLDADTRTALARAGRAALPVLLSGEPGTGKSLVARTHLVRPGSRFHRCDLLPPGGLDGLAATLPPGATLYLSSAEALTAADQADLLALLDQPAAAPLQVVLAAAERAPLLASLRDDLRLRLETVAVHLRPLRRHPEAVPATFRRALAALAARLDLEPPPLGRGVAEALSAHPWPLNFEELTAVATRCLLHVGDRRIELEDLGLPRRPGADRGEERAGEETAAEPDQETAAGGPRLARAATVRDGGGTAGRDQRTLEALVEDLAHEVRNPLVSIKTYTQLLPERFDDPEFRASYQRLVPADVDRIEGVLAELASFARLRPPAPARTDLAAVVRRVLDAEHLRTRKPSIEIVARLPERPALVETDGELLAHALDAVLREALAAVPDGGRVELAVPAGARARPASVGLRFHAGGETVRPLRGDRRGQRREVLGLRYNLAAHILGLLGGRLEVEDVPEGETRITMSLDLA